MSANTASASEAPVASDAQQTGKGKGKRKPIKPDVEQHKAQLEQLNITIQQQRGRSDEIKQMIDHKKQSGGSPEQQQAKAKLNQLSASFKAELDKKKALREELNALNALRDKDRAKIRELKAKIGANPTPQKLEEKIKNLEDRIHHSTVDLKEENRIREEVKKLQSLRPQAGQYVTAQENLKSSESQRENILSQLKASDGKLSDIKAQEEQQRSFMNDLRSKEAAKSQDIPSLIKEREQCREVINALYQKIQELRDEHKAKHDAYWEEFQQYRKQVQEERQERDALREKEYQEREANRRAAQAEFAGEPYHKEIALCEQLYNHLGKFVQSAQEPSTSSRPADVDTSTAFEGMKAVKKDKDSNEGFEAYLGTGRKGKSKKGKAGSSSQAPAEQKLNHSLDMIDAFGKLKISIPTTTSKVPDAIKEVEQSKDYWMKKRAEAKESGVLPTDDLSSKPITNGIAKGNKEKSKPAKFNLEEDFPDINGTVVAKKSDTAENSANSNKDVNVNIEVTGDKVSVILSSA